MLVLLKRRSGKTICPSEVARAVATETWRDLMDDVRAVACQLADEGAIEVLQSGDVVDPRRARGPIRLRLKEPAG